jgi:integrase/recombinase XerD
LEQQQQVTNKKRFLDNNEEDPNFDRKLDIITAGARPFVKEHLLTKITRENCQILIDYILAMQTEVNPSQTYRIDAINKLKHFAEELHNRKSFRDVTREDIIDFLDNLRKPESVDPLHKWIGTHETYRIILLRFFRWLHRPSDDSIPHNKRPKPAIMENIPKIKRKETSIYKPTDLWTEEDDALFYKYCPSPRERCWHAVSRDTGCRPHELLKLKIKDIVLEQRDDGRQVARIRVNGKTGTRNVRIYNSYPRLKEWLANGHPFPGLPDAALFCGSGKKNTGKRLAPHSIGARYEYYKKIAFPKLLDDPLVLEEDKRKIRELLKKPWNPYVRRHTAATEISKAIKDSVLIDQYLGWSHRGNTRQKYQHYYADDAYEAMLTTMDGLAPSSGLINNLDKKKNFLKPKQCPHCDESNKPEARFCAKCKFVLSFDAFNETIEEADKMKKELVEIKAQQQLQQQLQKEERERQLANEEDMRARVDRLYHELMRENGERLKKIKNENKRNVEESQLLWDAAAAAEVELEGELEEEAADKRLAAYEAGNLEFTEA